MPIYEYRCQNCEKISEFFQKLSDAPKTECPSCKKNTLKKQISSTNFQLKGSGWYVTDFRDQKKPLPADKKSEPAKKSTSEAKPKDSGDKKK